MVPRVGLEPTTLGLEVLCSIQLSYQGVFWCLWCGWGESNPHLQLGRLAY